MKTNFKPRQELLYALKMLIVGSTIFLLVLSVFNCSKEDENYTKEYEQPIQQQDQLKSSSTIENGFILFYQNELFVRATGKPIIVRRQIGNSTIHNYEGCFQLHVQSGLNGEDFVSSAIVKVDDKTYLNTSDFNNSNQSYTFDLCNLTETSVMEVEIYGTPGSTLEIWIEGTLAKSGTFVDFRDGKQYKWVKIGTQIWMAENLAYLPSVSPHPIGSNTDPYYYVYDYDGYNVNEAVETDNFKTYGVLYNWPAVMQGAISSNSNPSGVQGISPDGWHIPSDAEWSELEACLGGIEVAGAKLKEVGTSHWVAPNLGATNESGFAGLPAGQRWFTGGGFVEIGTAGYWWSSTEKGVYEPYIDCWMKGLFYNSAYFSYPGSYAEAGYGFSVRCVKD